MNKTQSNIETNSSDPCEHKANAGYFMNPGPTPLTDNQRGIWMAQIHSPESSHFNLGFRARIKGKFLVGALINAIQAVVAGNDALRLVIDGSDGNVPCLRLLNDADIEVQEIDISDENHDELSIAELAQEIVRRPFKFDGSLLIRNTVFCLGNNDFLWVCCFHHIIADGIGGMNLYNQVAETYDSLVKGNQVESSGSSFLACVKDNISSESPARRRKDLEYWQSKFVDAPDEVLASELKAYTGNRFCDGLLRRAVSRRLVDQATQLCNANGCSFVHFMLAVIATYFYKTEHFNSFSIDSTTHGRSNRALRDVVGMFSSVMPVSVKADDQMSFGDLVRFILNDMRRSYRHQRVPIDEIQRASGTDRGLVDISFSFDQFPLWGSLGGCDARVQRVYGDKEFGKLAISLSDFHADDDPYFEYSFNQNCLSESRVVDISLRIEEIMKHAVEGWDVSLGELSMLHDGEFDRLIYGFNDSVSTYPKEALIHELFEQQVHKTPDTVAVQYENEQLTYAELNAKANQLAHRLRALTDNDGHPLVRPDALVAISVERSLEMVVGLVGILKAGAAYVPVDPEYPAERIAYMIEDSQARVLLTQKALLARLPASVQATETVVLLDDELTYAGQPVGNIGKEETGQTSRHLAYVIYTSGSTGLPKGVMNEHRGVVNMLLAETRAYHVESSSRVLQFASFSFDACITEIFTAFCGGASLYVADRETLMPGEPLRRFLAENRITHATLPPVAVSALGQGAEAELALQTLAVVGDICPVSLAQVWSPGRRFINGYGPTEASACSTMYEVDAAHVAELTTTPIGRPLANARIYILERTGQPAPMGVTGEIHIGGDGVARGYLNRPELTEEKFIADPFSDEPGARMYKTGDLGRWREDGTIEYVGRNDFQVKIRGFRVELGEIEARLAALPEVREAIVIAREDQPGDKRLVAYWTTPEDMADTQVPTVEQLRDHLKAELPAYMVPAAFVKLEVMPLTPNGKVDRKALPAPEADALITHAYEAPQGKTEEVLAAIWQELLGVERVGRHDNFFDLGGHSLLIVSMAERLRQQGLAVEIRQVFESQSLVALAQVLTHQVKQSWQAPPNLIPEGCTHITPEMLPLVTLSQGEIDWIAAKTPGGMANIQDIYPLAPLQEGILFHHRLSPESDAYVTPAILRFESRARFDGFVAALNRVIQRHDVLRAAVLWDELPRAVQVVHRQAELPVRTFGQGRYASKERALEALQRFVHEGRFSMDLAQPPLLRLEVAEAEGDEGCHALLMTHHLINDHVSLEVLIEEVSQVLAGHEQALQASPVQYRTFVANSLESVDEAKAEAYFRELLGDVQEPTAPFGLLDVRGDGRGVAEASIAVEAQLAGEIRAVAQRLNVSPAVLFHVAWALVVARCSGRDDVVFGSVFSGRMGGVAGADRMLGMFINTLPVRMTLAGVSVHEAVKAMQQTLVSLLAHEQTPLALAQRCSGVDGSMPLFSAMLNYRHSAPMENQAAFTGMEVLGSQERTNYPFDVSVDDLGEGFMLTAQTQADTVAPQRVVNYLHRAAEDIVQALKAAPQTAVLKLSILPEVEREQVLRWFNDTAADYPKEALIHELFEQQVQKTPDAVAVQYENERLSYAELNAKANQLAHRLRALTDDAGCPVIRPDALVAISVERSLEMVVGLVGILKAGAAYVPVDPEYPPERIAYMLEDSQARVLLTQSYLESRLTIEPESTTVLRLDDEATYANQPTGNMAAKLTGQTSRHLAYVIYTSGSTGLPKGVMVEHQGVISRLWWMQQEYQLTSEDRMLQKTIFSFDVSVPEVFWALMIGARSVVARPDGHKDTAYLSQVIKESKITVLDFVPSMLQAFISHIKEGSGYCVHNIIAAGEELPLPLQKQCFACLPDSNLHNLYGPTEATIYATYWTSDIDQNSGLVPIGRPIANTQIYILDDEGQPVPIGVAGEIHIGGDGVARGYLNRPELTAEKFIPDPFSTDPDARMYKTGDLGRWREDGTIEYVGRNDFQVKIRGLRIELGEIEARLAELPEVREAIVIAREDHPGDKRLVAYWTTPQGMAEAQAPSVEQLRDHLKALLPAYMVPAAFVRLEAMPLTPNGKVDRKALPAPEAGALITHAYEAPQGETEEVLAAIWQEVLGVEQVGRHDNFFDLGGHSLLITQAVVRVEQTLRVKLPLRVMFEQATLRDLAATIEATQRQDRAGDTQQETMLDLGKEVVLDPMIQLPSSPVAGLSTSIRTAANAQAILLTGATGFLGAYLLHELLNSTPATVYCLVRARTPKAGRDRIVQNLQRYGLWHDVLSERIVPACGDMEKPLLGLEQTAFDMLAEHIDLIIHNGAWVNFIYPYETLKAANVMGTQEVIRLAAQTKVKPLHFVSTVSVFPHTNDPDRRMLESEEPQQWQGLDGGYPQSKWVAEKLVYLAGRRGLPVNIHRPGSIWGDVHSGACNTGDLVFRLIKGCMELGLAPKTDAAISLVPVDYVSRAIVRLASLPQTGTRAFNLINPHGSDTYTRIFELARELGYRVEITSLQQWRHALLEAVKQNEQHVLYPFLGMQSPDEPAPDGTEADESDEDSAYRDPTLDCKETLEGLKGTSIACPEIDARLMKVYFDYFERSGFIDLNAQ